MVDECRKNMLSGSRLESYRFLKFQEFILCNINNCNSSIAVLTLDFMIDIPINLNTCNYKSLYSSCMPLGDAAYML